MNSQNLKEKLEDLRERSKNPEYWLGTWAEQLEELAKADEALFHEAS